MRVGKYSLLIGVLYLAMSGGAAWSTAGWTSYGSVVELNPTNAGRFLVRLDVATNPSGCKDKQWFYLDYKDTGTELMFQALLSALTTGQKVRLHVTGSCDLNGYSEVSSVSVVP